MVLFTTTKKKKKSSELLTLVTAFMRKKYKQYIFYGVIICDKHSSIVNVKKGISDSHEATKNSKIF